jgi:hypothetical protein
VYIAGISNSSGLPDIGSTFYGQFWGTINQTLALFASIFPELRLSADECQQGDWAQVGPHSSSCSTCSFDRNFSLVKLPVKRCFRSPSHVYV